MTTTLLSASNETQTGDKTMAATKQGNTWYTDDAEYAVDGDTIRRGDGSYTVVDDGIDADAVAQELANGDRNDGELEWSDE